MLKGKNLMKCNSCGIELEAGKKKCQACGAKQPVKKAKKANEKEVSIPVKTMLLVLAGIVLVGATGLGLLSYQVRDNGNTQVVEVPEESYHYEIAVQAFDSGDYDLAIAEMTKVAELSKDEGLKRQALHTIGMSYYFSGEYDQAITSFSLAQDIALSFHTSAYMGDAYTQLGKQAEAYEWLSQANQIEAENYLYHEFMAFFHYKFMDLNAMINEIDNAINLGSDNLYLYELKVIAFHLSGQDFLRDETLSILERSEYTGLDELYKRLGFTRDYLFEKVSLSEFNLTFFEGDDSVVEVPASAQTAFKQSEARFIYWNLNYEVTPLKNSHPMLVRAIYRDENGTIVSDSSDYLTIEKESVDGSFFWGIGSGETLWKTGEFEVEILIEDTTVSTGRFTITE